MQAYPPRTFLRFTLLALTMLLLVACQGSSQQQWQLNNVTGHLSDLDFKLTGDSGQTVTGKDLRGKVVMLYFGYTHCPDVCPLSLAHLHAVMQRLGKLADQVRIVFVSVDPERDTPKVLHHYVSAFDKYAIGVTGSSDAIRDLTRDYRVAFSHEKPDSDGNYEVSHSSAVFIFDRKGKARLISGSADNIDAITHDVRQLIEESP